MTGGKETTNGEGKSKTKSISQEMSLFGRGGLENSLIFLKVRALRETRQEQSSGLLM